MFFTELFIGAFPAMRQIALSALAPPLVSMAATGRKLSRAISNISWQSYMTQKFPTLRVREMTAEEFVRATERQPPFYAAR